MNFPGNIESVNELLKESKTPGQLWSRIHEVFGQDPIVRFEDSVRGAAIEVDTRSDEQLIHDAQNHFDPAAREHAVYQLVYRRGASALSMVEEMLEREKDSQARVNMLWLLQEIPNERCRKVALGYVNDQDSRVREWARVFCWEAGWSPEDFRVKRPATYLEGKSFDETLFLHIKSHLFMRLSPNNDVWGHVYLSPQMLARVYGQALACPVTETRERSLVLCKTLRGLHDDGSDHYESFHFRGFTERKDPLQGNFFFEAHSPRPFYKSGRADDASEGMVDNVIIPFAREGQWLLNEHIKIKEQPAIEYVRGRFQGWAFVNLARIMQSGGSFLFPGNSVLSTLHHPEVGPMTNTFLAGTFKGKVLDWDGDGILDLNPLDVHATRDGEIDTDMDGVPDAPGRSVCTRTFR
jgi:hypothetical protein